jgi:hypothetical protein
MTQNNSSKHLNQFLAHHHLVHSKQQKEKIKFIVFVSAFIILGSLSLLLTSAQTIRRYAVLEPELGTTTGTAIPKVVNDTNASGGKYINFDAPAPVVTVPTPPAPVNTNPSGVPMPVGNLEGWDQIFSDDFTTNVPIGSFPTAVSDKWGGYPYPYRDTRGQRSSDPTVGGWYHPGKTISIGGGMMDIWVHTELIDGVKKRLVAAPEPKINGPNATGPNGVNGQLYGRYAVRFRLDPNRMVNNARGYKTAWLLWPKSNVWPRDGEIDFPEGSLNGKIQGFLHKQDATVGSDQYYALTNEVYTDWHTAVIEWGPDKTSFLLDGNLITNASGGKSEWTERIPNTPMRYILQTETSLSGEITPEDSEGHIQIDWITVYKKAN